MKNIYWIIPLMIVLTSLSFILGNNSQTAQIQESQGLNYHGIVCTTILRADGTFKDNGCNSNTLYYGGQNMTRDLLRGTAIGPILNITLCNTTGNACGTPAIGMGEAWITEVSCGMNSRQGTAASLIRNGNWSVWKTFTSTCNNRKFNVTRIGNSSGSFLAGNLFTLATLQTNDQLTVNWTLFVE